MAPPTRVASAAATVGFMATATSARNQIEGITIVLTYHDRDRNVAIERRPGGETTAATIAT